MRRGSYFTVLFLTLLSLKVSGQYIIAGAHDSSAYFFDIIPDKKLHVSTSLPNYTADTLLIDINNDNINDFNLLVENENGGNWYHYTNCVIVPLNNSQISVAGYDSCFANCPPPSFLYQVPMAKAYSAGDSISESHIWLDSSAFLAFNRWNASIPNACGYGCNGEAFYSSSNYLGVRIFTSNDTLYGWIQVKDVSWQSDSLSIESFACNLLSTSIGHIDNNSVTILYPNPSSGKISIQNNFLPSTSCYLSIYNLLGNLIYSETIKSRITELDLSHMAKGIYYVKLMTENIAIVSKLILE